MSHDFHGDKLQLLALQDAGPHVDDALVTCSAFNRADRFGALVSFPLMEIPSGNLT